MKQVKKSYHNKYKFYFTIYDYIRLNSKLPSLPISKQNLAYYTSILKKGGYIKRVGYGTWLINRSFKDFDPKQVKKVITIRSKLSQASPETNRGHAFTFTLKLPKIDNWNKREEYLIKQNIPYTRLNNLGGGQRIDIKQYTIHLKNKSLIIWDNKSYFAKLAKDTKLEAINTLFNLLTHLENLFNTSFKINKQYCFKVRREHYALIKNCIAKQRYKEGQPYLKVSDSNGVWFLIDNSYNLFEAETIRVNEAVSDNVGLQNYLNSHKRTNWGVTPDFTLSMFNNLIQDRAYWAKHQKSHVAAIQELAYKVNLFGEGTNKLIEGINKLLRILKKK